MQGVEVGRRSCLPSMENSAWHRWGSQVCTYPLPGKSAFSACQRQRPWEDSDPEETGRKKILKIQFGVFRG